MSKTFHMINNLSQTNLCVKRYLSNNWGWKQKKKRGQKASEAQKGYLIDYLEQRPDLANDKFTSADGAHSRDNEWKELSVKLNSLGGTVKDGLKWRKYWKDLVISVRSRDANIRDQRQKSGVNGLSQIKDLTESDRRIINIITPLAVEGVSATVGEMGFGEIVIERIEDVMLNEDSAISSEIQQLLEEEEEAVPTQITNTATTTTANTTTTTTANTTTTNAATATTARNRPKRRTLCSASDDAFSGFKELEEKKIKLEERKIELMEQNNIIFKDIHAKLEQLLEVLLNN